MAKSISCKAEGSVNNVSPVTGLHNRSLSSHRSSVSAFTLIEVLIVVLVMGVLFGTGLSVYSGVTRDSQLRTRTDELTSFFAACRYRAMLRKTPIHIVYENGNLGIDQSHNLHQRIPEVDSHIAEQLFNGLSVEHDGRFTRNGRPVERLILPVNLPGGHAGTIRVEL